MRKWMPKLLRVAGIGACYGMAFVGLASLLFAFREPDLFWDAVSLSSPADIGVTLVAFTVASALGGALCSLQLYFVCWLLRYLWPKAVRHGQ
ncbi:hypothetical protein [uncultured Sneathiella sp.]|jgi:hypothetical protein|uniref:hypothetical protein n=1 Tax=uncultured Sneathiella sp. TaxID=879315 RepID=UPI0030EB4AFC|tara:strand:- start:191 stop:466 length:276 start_codon:yes stop_codon:yes gene_type:complete